MKDRVQHFHFALSPNTDVVVIFDGDEPDAKCFENLKLWIALAERSLLARETAITKKTMTKRTERPPCAKHPDSPRHSSTNRCMECLKEHAQNMVLARRKNFKAV